MPGAGDDAAVREALFPGRLLDGIDDLWVEMRRRLVPDALEADRDLAPCCDAGDLSTDFLVQRRDDVGVGAAQVEGKTHFARDDVARWALDRGLADGRDRVWAARESEPLDRKS